MKVSIITSVFNNEKHIEDAINSVLSQTYSNIEYIIIDGNSKDNTKKIIEKYLDKIDIFVSEPDKGIYDGLNKGILKATGDIIGFLHSDDIYYNNKVIEKVVKAFKKDIDGVYGDLVYIKDNKVIRYWKSGEFSIEKLKKGWMPPHPTLFLKKSIYEKYGLFDLNFKIAGDYDFILRILKNNINLKYIPEILYKMRVGGASNKSLKNILQKSNEDLKALYKNNIGGIDVLFRKNFSKITQFIKKESI